MPFAYGQREYSLNLNSANLRVEEVTGFAAYQIVLLRVLSPTGIVIYENAWWSNYNHSTVPDLTTAGTYKDMTVPLNGGFPETGTYTVYFQMYDSRDQEQPPIQGSEQFNNSVRAQDLQLTLRYEQDCENALVSIFDFTQWQDSIESFGVGSIKVQYPNNALPEIEETWTTNTYPLPEPLIVVPDLVAGTYNISYQNTPIWYIAAALTFEALTVTYRTPIIKTQWTTNCVPDSCTEQICKGVCLVQNAYKKWKSEKAKGVNFGDAWNTFVLASSLLTLIQATCNCKKDASQYYTDLVALVGDCDCGCTDTPIPITRDCNCG